MIPHFRMPSFLSGARSGFFYFFLFLFIISSLSVLAHIFVPGAFLSLSLLLPIFPYWGGGGGGFDVGV